MLIQKTTLTIVSAFLLILSSTANAAWTLNSDDSHLSYLSTKILADGSASSVERNEFKKLSGKIAKDGTVEVMIDLTSIETNIPIRNERMQKFVFGAEQSPNAVISAQVPLDSMSTGTHQMMVAATLSINGQSKNMEIPVVVSASDDQLTVVAMEPVMVQAEDLGMSQAILKLTELAGLLHIPTAVPVSFNLHFIQ